MSRVIVPSLATSAGSGPAQAAEDMAPSPVESCLWLEGSDGGQCGPQDTQEGCAFRASLTTWAESLAGEGLGSWPELSHGRLGIPEPLLFLWARGPPSWVNLSRTGVFREKFRAALLHQIASRTVLSGF